VVSILCEERRIKKKLSLIRRGGEWPIPFLIKEKEERMEVPS